MICPDLEALGIASERSLFFVKLDMIANMPQAFIETMACTTLGHRLLQYEHDVSSKDSMVIGHRLQRHRGNAIRCLAELIANPASQYKDKTLVSTITFLLSEVSPTFSLFSLPFFFITKRLARFNNPSHLLGAIIATEPTY